MHVAEGLQAMAEGKGNKKKTKKAKQKPSGSAEAFDLSSWMQGVQIPGLDVTSLVESGRADVEAVQQANQAAVEGWQKLAQKQTELLQDAMQQWQSNLTNSLSGSAEDNIAQQSEMAQQGFANMLENMKEMAQIVTESQTKAAEILGKRFEENVARMMNAGSKKD